MTRESLAIVTLNLECPFYRKYIQTLDISVPVLGLEP